jgi:hypothetical protein
MNMYSRRAAPVADTDAAEAQIAETPGAGPSDRNSSEATAAEEALKRKVSHAAIIPRRSP